MNEKQRSRRIRDELTRARAELARQDRDVDELEAGLDPGELAEAERTFDQTLRRLERREETPTQATVPTFAVRV